MRILIVGQNPSSKNTDVEVPFEGTASGRRLKKWLKELGLEGADITFKNASYVVDRAPKASEIRSDIPWFCFHARIALGEQASRALLSSGCPYNGYFRLPHPSGLNRKLNNKEELANQIHLCREYLNSCLKLLS